MEPLVSQIAASKQYNKVSTKRSASRLDSVDSNKSKSSQSSRLGMNAFKSLVAKFRTFSVPHDTPVEFEAKLRREKEHEKRELKRANIINNRYRTSLRALLTSQSTVKGAIMKHPRTDKEGTNSDSDSSTETATTSDSLPFLSPQPTLVKKRNRFSLNSKAQYLAVSSSIDGESQKSNDRGNTKLKKRSSRLKLFSSPKQKQGIGYIGIGSFEPQGLSPSIDGEYRKISRISEAELGDLGDQASIISCDCSSSTFEEDYVDDMERPETHTTEDSSSERSGSEDSESENGSTISSSDEDSLSNESLSDDNSSTIERSSTLVQEHRSDAVRPTPNLVDDKISEVENGKEVSSTISLLNNENMPMDEPNGNIVGIDTDVDNILDNDNSENPIEGEDDFVLGDKATGSVTTDSSVDGDTAISSIDEMDNTDSLESENSQTEIFSEADTSESDEIERINGKKLDQNADKLTLNHVDLHSDSQSSFPRQLDDGKVDKDGSHEYYFTHSFDGERPSISFSSDSESTFEPTESDSEIESEESYSKFGEGYSPETHVLIDMKEIDDIFDASESEEEDEVYHPVAPQQAEKSIDMNNTMEKSSSNGAIDLQRAASITSSQGSGIALFTQLKPIAEPMQEMGKLSIASVDNGLSLNNALQSNVEQDIESLTEELIALQKAQDSKSNGKFMRAHESLALSYKIIGKIDQAIDQLYYALSYSSRSSMLRIYTEIISYCAAALEMDTTVSSKEEYCQKIIEYSILAKTFITENSDDDEQYLNSIQRGEDIANAFLQSDE